MPLVPPQWPYCNPWAACCQQFAHACSLSLMGNIGGDASLLQMLLLHYLRHQNPLRSRTSGQIEVTSQTNVFFHFPVSWCDDATVPLLVRMSVVQSLLDLAGRSVSSSFLSASGSPVLGYERGFVLVPPGCVAFPLILGGVSWSWYSGGWKTL